MSTVHCKDLVKRFANLNVVDHIDVEIQDGEFMVFVGPSGCGKSTTLRMIGGLESITSGEIFIDGQLVNHIEPRHRDIAMVFQNYALYPHYKVFDNIAYSLKLRKRPKTEIEQRVREVARTIRIEHLLERWPRQLSGGERQRVALGRAIIRNPRLFLMDEPLSNLDAQLRVQMRQEIVRLQRQLRTTTVYVTHDQVEAMTMGDRIMVMRNGRIQQLGQPETLYNRPANLFVAQFIGSPAMNLNAGEIVQDGGRMVLQASFGALPLPEEIAVTLMQAHSPDIRKITWGIRSEHVQIVHDGAGAVQATVDLVESLGADAYATVRINGNDITARTPANLRPREGERVGLQFNLDHVHVFDTQTEMSLL